MKDIIAWGTKIDNGQTFILVLWRDYLTVGGILGDYPLG